MTTTTQRRHKVRVTSGRNRGWHSAPPGGWLVSTQMPPQSEQITFVPDPKHEWDTESTLEQLRLLRSPTAR